MSTETRTLLARFVIRTLQRAAEGRLSETDAKIRVVMVEGLAKRYRVDLADLQADVLALIKEEE